MPRRKKLQRRLPQSALLRSKPLRLRLPLQNSEQ
jgi:hypothetical protein